MKTTYSFLLILILQLILVGCNNINQAIKKDLNSRFTKFEIVEIRKDSSNVEEAFNMLLSLKVNISDGNLEIVKAGNHFYDVSGYDKWSYEKTTNYMNSITNKLLNMCHDFMYLQFSKSEPCYYVKYRIFKDELKVEKEEYYYFRIYDDGKKTELLHRPCNWNDFLYEQKCIDLIDKCSEPYREFLNEIIGNKQY
jgi:hypothetical protein